MAAFEFSPGGLSFKNPDPLAQAITLAGLVHHGQVDRGGDPYFWHVLRVGSSLLPDVDAAIVGVLHDVLEDCIPAWRDDLFQLLREFGANVKLAVRELTRPEDETYEHYIQRVAHGTLLVRKVKMADLYDNLNPDRLARAAANGVDIAPLATKYAHALGVLHRVAI
jgi:(p)ppGpp synthase/HD superfamily hydrolase